MAGNEEAGYLLDVFARSVPYHRYNSDIIAETVMKFDARIIELRKLAADEGANSRYSSEKDFASFFIHNPFLKYGTTCLDNDGCLSVSWRVPEGGMDTDFVHLIFPGNSMVQFNIRKNHGETKKVSRIYGAATMNGIRSILFAMGLDKIMYYDYSAHG